MANRFTESTLEEAFLDYLASLGWQVAFGPDIAPSEPFGKRRNYRDALLTRLMRGEVRVR
jgi:type I restriction enzyme, R subunit